MTQDPHRWLRARLDARALGLLSEADEERFAAHLAGCAACADAAEAHRAHLPEAPLTSAHIPSTLLASWPRAAAELRGVERRLVRDHLASCAECRRDLALLGHTSELPADPHARSTARTWWLGGAAGAALATAASLLIYFGALRTEPRQSAPPEPPLRQLVRADELALAPPSAVLRPATRSGPSAAFAQLAVPDSTSVMALHLPEWSGSSAAPVRVRIEWPDGRDAVEQTFRFDELLARREVLLRAGSTPLPLGEYRIETTFGPDPATPGTPALTLTSRLRLVPAGPGAGPSGGGK